MEDYQPTFYVLADTEPGYIYPGLCEEEIRHEELASRSPQEADILKHSIYRDSPPELILGDVRQRQMALANLVAARQQSLIAHYQQMRRSHFRAKSATSTILSAVAPLVKGLFPRR